MFQLRTGRFSVPHRCAVLLLAFGLVACSEDENGGSTTGISGGDQVEISATPSAVNFPVVLEGQVLDLDVTLRHVGKSGTLTLRNLRLEVNSDELSLVDASPVDLEPGMSATYTIRYAPVDGDQDGGVLLVDTNVLGLGDEPYEVQILTTAQVGSLLALPNPLDFGTVVAGTTETQSITFLNNGFDDVEVFGVQLALESSMDFAISNVPEFPLTAGAGDSFEVSVSYTPSGGGLDEGWVDLLLVSEGVEDSLRVQIDGAEVGPNLSVFPAIVDFGWRSVDIAHQLPLFLNNEGNESLEFSLITLSPESDSTLSLVNAPTGGASVQAGQGYPAPDAGLGEEASGLMVQFTPTSDMVQTTGPLGQILIESNDSADGGVKTVFVYGRPEVPFLQVNPSDLVDFAYVAQGYEAKRKVSLYNAGSSPVTVTSVSITNNAAGEFSLKNDESWGPTSTQPSPGLIEIGEHREIEVAFVNNGADNGTEWGELTIESNDGQSPTWNLDMKAQRAGSPECHVSLLPDQLDFGIVPRGFSKTMTMSLVVDGSGPCSFNSLFVNNCESWGGFFDTGCSDPSQVIQLNGDSDYYDAVAQIPAIQGFLQPGDVFPIDVTFTPPDTAPLFGDETTDYGGLLGVRVFDDNDGSDEYQIFPESQVGGFGDGFAANLHAKSGMAELSVFPQEIDFGLVTIGCYSQTFTIHAYNVGTAPLDLTAWELVGVQDGCGPEFKIKSFPGVPKTLAPAEGVEFEVVYVPQDPGPDTCSLALTTNDADTPSAVVPIKGGGTFEDHHIDEFIQSSGQDVDVLFVVDDSGSMGEEQSNLSNNFQTFIGSAATWNNDYHVGVTTTDLDAAGGALVGDPRYVTNANWQTFSNNVQVGTSGSGTEKGLAAAQMALSLPNTSDTGIACASNAECEPEQCVDGICGGPNRGFLRKDASLEVVFVSDEEDQSPADLAFYTNFFKNMKGFFNDNLFHAHAIVGPSGGCSSGDGDAVAGHRYMDLANATGGNIISICDPNWAQGLASIGEIAFGLKVQFFLSRVADPPTITVTVAGAPCASSSGGASNWAYDPGSNSVVFEENGGCMPTPGQEIVIEYDTLCFLE